MSQNSEDGEVAAENRYPLSAAHFDVEAIDGSEVIFAMYLEMSLREDEEMVEAWNKDAKTTLLFSGLFSATVAAALGPTLPALTPDISSAYLELIYDQLVLANGSTPISVESDLTPKSSYQTVNSLWFLTLVTSLTCALLAVLLQQWTLRYLSDVRQRRTLCSQARVREHLAEGMRISGIAIIADIMRGCHQLSFTLFATGLSIYLSSTSSASATGIVVSCWFLLWALLYMFMTVGAMSRNNSPYHSTLSSILYHFVQLFLLPGSMTSSHVRRTTRVPASHGIRGFLGMITPEGMRKSIKDSIQEFSEHLDNRILQWTFESLKKDHEFERFFSGIPDFCDSRVVNDPIQCLLELNGPQKKLSRALFGWIHRTMTSHQISEPARLKRIKICLKVVDALPTLVSWSALRSLFEKWEGSVDSRSAASRAGGNSYGTTGDPFTSLYVRCIVVILLARAQVHDRDWFDLTTQFSRSHNTDKILSVLQGSLEEHDHSSALLANLILITRFIFRFYSKQSRGKVCNASFETLRDLTSHTLCELSSKIDVRHASPKMQHEFCHLWNLLVGNHTRAHSDSDTAMITGDILRYLHGSYIALHESPDASSSLSYTSTDDDFLIPPFDSPYDQCDVPDHRRTSSQAHLLTTVNITNLPPSCPPFLISLDSIPPNPGEGDAEASNDASPAGASHNLAVQTAPRAPQAAQHITPAAQESHGLTGTPPSTVNHSLSSPDVPMAQYDRTSSTRGR